jgi:uncharacterized membrane protein
MNQVKRYLGVIWIVIGLGAVYYLLKEQAFPKFEKGGAENTIPAIIYTFVLAPLILGALIIFGRYCLNGEYDTEE